MLFLAYYNHHASTCSSAIPRGASRVMDYGKKRFVPEVGKNAWGNVDYKRALSTAEIADYEPFSYPKN